jgi:nucleobase transporter 1/2
MGTCVEIGLPMLILLVALSQYLKHVQIGHVRILERFSVLISIAVVWAYAHVLTVSGAHKHDSLLTQLNCRTDQANLTTTAPWSELYRLTDALTTALFFHLFLSCLGI